MIELMVVILILGLLCSGAILGLKAVKRHDTAQVALEACRRNAIRGGRERSLQLDTLLLRCLPDGEVLGARRGQLVGRWP